MNWKGEEAGYHAKHIWLSKHYEKHFCKFCNISKNDVSRLEWANLSRQYKRDINDWIVLCPSCHRKFDYGEYCKHGHKFTNKNTYITPKGFRQCRECQRSRKRKHAEKN